MKIFAKTHRLLSFFFSFLLLFQSFAPALAYAAEEITPEPTPTEQISPTPELEQSETSLGETTPTEEITPDLTPTEIVTPYSEPSSTPTPSEEIILGPTATISPSPETTPSATPMEEVVPTTENQPTPQETPASQLDQQPTSTTVTADSTSLPTLTPTPTPQIEESVLAATKTSPGRLFADQLDYSPTDRVTITGTGFTPFQIYSLIFSSTDYPGVSYFDLVITDGVGNFTYSRTLDGTYRPNYSVELRDLSGDVVASTAFTDASTKPTAPDMKSPVVNSSSSITVNWEDKSDNEDDFHLFRKLQGADSTYGEIAVISTPNKPGKNETVSYTDTGLSCDTGYVYKVQAHRHDTSEYSNSSGTTSPDTLYLSIADVTDLTPAYAAAGSTSVPILSFTLSSCRSSGKINSVKVEYTGTNKNDIANLKLYQESGAAPGVFSSSSDTLLATDSTGTSSNEYYLNIVPNLTLGASTTQFYVTANLKSTATGGNKVDARILEGKISISDSPDRPLASELNLFNPDGETIIGSDTTPPTIASHADVTAEATSASGSTVTYVSPSTSDNVDSPGVASCSPVSGSVFPIGTTRVTCTASDTAGNSAIPTIFNVIVSDTTKPIIALLGLNPTTIEVDSIYSDAGATASDNIDGDITPSPISTVDTSTIGTYTVKYNVTDTAGNAADEVTRTINVVDSTPPVITVDVSPTPNESGWNNSDVTVSWTVTDSGSDISSTSGCETSIISDETDGQLLTCSATSAGGSSSNSVTIKLDKSKPIISGTQSPIANEDGWNNSDALIDFSCLDSGPSGIAEDSVAGTTLTREGRDQSATNTGICQDNAGNIADSSTVSGVNIDKTIPESTITSPESDSFWRAPITISGSSTDTDSGSGIARVNFYYRSPDDDSWQEIPDSQQDNEEGEEPFDWSFEWTPPTDGSFDIKAEATDLAGNSEASPIVNNITYDTTNPTLPIATPAAGDYQDDQAVALTSSDGGSSLAAIYYTIDGSTPDSSKTLYTAPITVDKDTTIKAIAYDNAGNVSDILTAAYGIAPQISSESSTAVTTTTATITWTTDDPATSRVVYDTVSHPELGSAPNYDYANSTVETDTDPKVTDHAITLTGLIAGTTYYYRVVSHGSPEKVGAEQSFATGQVLAAQTTNGGGDGRSDGLAGQPIVCNDVKPGSAPTLISAIAGVNSVVLRWTEGLDPLTYYLVTYGAAPGAQTYGNPNIGGKGTTSYTVNGLSGGTRYYFRVRAGNGCMPGGFSNEISAVPFGVTVSGPAEGFAPGVQGASTDLMPTPTQSITPTEESTPSVLGAVKDWPFPWWLILLLLAGGSLAYWKLARRD